MKLGLMVGYSGATIDFPIDLIKRAEKLGYDSVWTSEAYGSDAMTPLAWIAAQTSRIRLGTAIAQLAGRPPAMCAMQAMTIDGLAGDGRMIVGLGVSGPQIVEGWYGQPWGSRPSRRASRGRATASRGTASPSMRSSGSLSPTTWRRRCGPPSPVSR